MRFKCDFRGGEGRAFLPSSWRYHCLIDQVCYRSWGQPPLTECHPHAGPWMSCSAQSDQAPRAASRLASCLADPGAQQEGVEPAPGLWGLGCQLTAESLVLQMPSRCPSSQVRGRASLSKLALHKLLLILPVTLLSFPRLRRKPVWIFKLLLCV